MTQEDIGARIAARRQQLGWTQEELAARVHVTRSTVVNWETGKHYPKRRLGLLEQVLSADLESEPDPPPFATPDEAAIWSMDRFTEAERRAMIRALQDERAGRTRP